MKRFLLPALLLFIFTGILVCYTGFSLYKAYDFLKNATPIQAEVTDKHGGYPIFIRPVYTLKYHLNDKDYVVNENLLRGNNYSDHSIGDNVTLAYDTRHPEIAHSQSFVWRKIRSLVSILIPCSVFFFPVLILMPYLYLRSGNRNQLKQYGMPIIADVTKVYKLDQLEKLGNNSYIAEAAWNDGDKSYNFKAFIDPSLAKDIKKLPFLIDPKNPKRYLLDTDRLNGLMKF